jgi:protein tyrosine/serine phosphatase
VNGARHLDWDGCFNARDLGGLTTREGHTTRWNAVVRADALDELSADGWDALQAHGIRTIIDLRNDGEGKHTPNRPPELTVLHLPLDQIEDTEFWDYWNSDWQCGTPLYYSAHIGRFPERSARVLAAIARAEPGGVVFHCVGGRDRTGLITLLLLSLLGVEPAAIVADYELSKERLAPLFARRGEPDQGPLIEEFLSSQGITLRAAIVDTLQHLDLDAWRRAGRLGDSDVAALRSRLLVSG